MHKLLVRLFLFALALVAASTSSHGQVLVSVTLAPPPLPVYEQPFCPAVDSIWVPGYWAWDGDGYYWVPGTWVLAPQPGLLWTPGYWGWVNGRYVFYDGYWGPRVGYYGGIVYGYGYFGQGYEGGRWENGHFFYNRSVNNVNVTTIHNFYNTTVVNNTTEVTRVSYNGGRGGVQAQPTAEEEAAAQERHFAPSSAQTDHMQAARTNQQLRASENHGLPPIAATPKPAAFNGSGIVPAKQGAAYNPEEAKRAEASRATGERPASTAGPTAMHPKDLPPLEPGPAPNTGDPKLDKKYQQQQEQLATRQEQERLKLQQQQERDHERLEQQKADEGRRQQTEQEHQRQTQQMTQQHAQQQQAQQAKQQPKQDSAHPKNQQY